MTKRTFRITTASFRICNQLIDYCVTCVYAGDLGGYLGLLIGGSALTLLEILDLVFYNALLKLIGRWWWWCCFVYADVDVFIVISRAVSWVMIAAEIVCCSSWRPTDFPPTWQDSNGSIESDLLYCINVMMLMLLHLRSYNIVHCASV